MIISFFIYISLFFNLNFIVVFVIAVYIFLRLNLINSLVFVVIFIFCFNINNLDYNKTNKAVVFEVKANSYILDTGAYKISYPSHLKLNLNDEIVFDENKLFKIKEVKDSFDYISNYYNKANNIKFILKDDDVLVIKKQSLKTIIYDFISNLKYAKYYQYFIYNIYSNTIKDDGFLGLGFKYYGLYLLLNFIFKKLNINSKYLLIFMSIYCYLIYNFGLFRIIIYYFFKTILKNKSEAIAFSILTILIIFPYKVYSLTMIYFFIIAISSLFKNKYFDVKTLIVILNSYFYYEINFIKLFLFKIINILNAFMLIISILLIPFPDIYIMIVKIYKIITLIINNKNFILEGKVNLLAMLFYFIFFKLIKINFSYKPLLIISCLIYFNVGYIFGEQIMINVGHGDAILLRSAFNKENILIDTGDYYAYRKLKNVLKSRRIKNIDYLIISHNDNDHSANLEALKKDFNVKKVINKHIDLKTKHFDFISINQDYSSKNDSSICYYTNINGLKYLFIGDISKEVELDIIKKYNNLKVDILKVAHHGSDTSSHRKFINEIKPLVSLISCGNKFNFPKKETLETLYNAKSNVYITKNSGDIQIINLKFINYLITSNNEFVIIKP